MKKISLFIGIFSMFSNQIFGQLEDIDSAYLKTLNKRAGKITESLDLQDQDQAARVHRIIVIQYFELSKIHDLRDRKLKDAEKLTREEQETFRQHVQIETNAALYSLHVAYLAMLAAELDQDQVDKVKDGMTYGVLPRTYSAYLDLLPDLTGEQKRYIYSCLYEAREFAIDAGSSEAKHAWFGKYKGRINNYLSDQGYDLKEAEKNKHSTNI